MGEDKKKQLILIGSEINTRDYVPVTELQGKTFNDLIDFLYKKYEEPIIAYARERMRNLELGRDRIAVKFQYADPSGSMVTIEPSEQVLNILGLTDTVYYTIETFGG
jgi:hypothetical protein